MSTARYVQNVNKGSIWEKFPIGSQNMLNIQFYYRYLSFQTRTISVKSLVSDFDGDDEKRWFTRGVRLWGISYTAFDWDLIQTGISEDIHLKEMIAYQGSNSGKFDFVEMKK